VVYTAKAIEDSNWWPEFSSSIGSCCAAAQLEMSPGRCGRNPEAMPLE